MVVILQYFVTTNVHLGDLLLFLQLFVCIESLC